MRYTINDNDLEYWYEAVIKAMKNKDPQYLDLVADQMFMYISENSSEIFKSEMSPEYLLKDMK